MTIFQMPIVTIITVVRNSPAMLRKTINSVSLQTLKDKEYVVIDGASTDTTLDVIHENSHLIDRWISEPDKGIYDAMNKGVRMSSGKWIIFMNAGDSFASSNTLTEIFKEQQDADIIFGDVIRHDAAGNAYIKKAEPVHESHRMFFCHQSSLVKRELLLQYPFDIMHRMSADFKFFKLMLHYGKTFRQLDFPISVFDTTGVSNTLRTKGLADNISVIREIDTRTTQIRLLPRLYFTYIYNRIRGK